jgi:phosphate transport system permease protein
VAEITAHVKDAMHRFLDQGFTWFSWLAALVTLAAVGILLGFLGAKGLGVLNLGLFFGEASPWQVIVEGQPAGSGLWPACVGTLYLVILSSLLAIPLGIGSGIYLAQYAPSSLKRLLIFAIDLLAGIPSILMGLFGFALILLLRKTLLPQANTCLLLSAGCLALLVLPYLIMTTQSTLEGLPEPLKVTGLSLGFTPWQNLVHVLLPAASRGILSGVVLAVGRAAEDTAVIMLTGVVANAGAPQSLTDKFAALPFHIYYLAAEYRSAGELAQAFGAALILLLLTGSLYAVAFWLHATLARKWGQTQIIRR